MEESPANVLVYLMQALSLGSFTSAKTDWPIYQSLMPDQPDNAICVYDTVGRKLARLAIGSSEMYHGAQVKVRGVSETVAYAKANAIAQAFDNVLRTTVVIGSNSYLVHSVDLANPIISLGNEVSSKRRLYTINVLTTITQIS